jgi:hypothetical protein
LIKNPIEKRQFYPYYRTHESTTSYCPILEFSDVKKKKDKYFSPSSSSGTAHIYMFFKYYYITLYDLAYARGKDFEDSALKEKCMLAMYATE